MVIRAFLAGLLLLASGLTAGCGDGDPSPFEGDWVSATAGRLSFEDDQWSDGEGDSGEFDFWGKYPEFTMRFTSDAGQFERTAGFCDERTFILCEQGRPDTDGCSPGADCHLFVYDKPTLH
jgi:hypothetical protein